MMQTFGRIFAVLAVALACGDAAGEVVMPAVRYAWAPNPKCSLYNSADLPASPFHTDNWPIEVDPNRR
ncbi:MAG: hypothetical protein ACYSWO_11725 [Planctomycetota bacterium]|jgi:hypothetical protein